MIELYAKYHEPPYSYVVNVILNIPNSAKISGGVLTQVVTNENKFNDIEVEPNYGYKYSYYEIDGTKYNNFIGLEKVNKDTTINVVLEYATYELPIINIDTNNVPILNKFDYVDMKFSIDNCDEKLSYVTGGIRPRGNSTSRYDKKPYRIKFDKKQSLFGL